MNRADVEMEDEQVFTGKPLGESTGAAVPRRGWWIGKWVAIAGAALTSAPIILPPLFVLSILGLALSLPCGIFLAGYACADKIMKALLPLPHSREKVVEKKELLSDTATGSDENRNTDVYSASLKGPYCVAVMDPAPSLSQEHLSVVEITGDAMSSDDTLVEKIHPKELMEGGGEEDGFVAKEKGLPEICSCEVESVRLSSDHLDEVASMEDSSVARLGVVNAGSGSGTGVLSEDERIQDEERLWDHIFAMRTIIGSKATIQASLGEELTALFLSVGVEPPLSLKNDAPELSEIINALRVLKAVVGVQ